MRKCIELFCTFARIGAMTFGGGYAMLPMLEREVVEKKQWATEEELADYFAIGQCTPGVIAVNTATFIGRKERGFAGALAATLGVVAPSVVIILLLASVISGFSDIAWVRDAFAGIRVAVCVLIFNAVRKLWSKAVIDARTLCVYAAVLLGAVILNLSPVLLVLLAGAFGTAYTLLWRRREK